MGIRYRMLLLNLLFDFDDLLLEILFLLLIFKFEGLLSNQNELKWFARLVKPILILIFTILIDLESSAYIKLMCYS